MKATILLGMLLFVFLLWGLEPIYATVEVDNLTIFATDTVNYTFSNGYNLSTDLSINNTRLDINHFYVFNVSSDAPCNITLYELSVNETKWNLSCVASTTKVENYIGNYSLKQNLYINETFDSVKIPSNFFVYFPYYNYTVGNFTLNMTAVIRINVLWGNGTPITQVLLFANNSTNTLSTINDSTIEFLTPYFLQGVSNLSVSKSYSVPDDYGRLTFYTASGNTTINNTGGFLDTTIYLYSSYVDIMGVQIFWIFMFILNIGFVYYGYWTRDYQKGLLSSIIGTLMGLIITFYSGGLTMLDAGTITMMWWGGMSLFVAGLMLTFSNFGGLWSKVA